jgi:TolB-like protein/cytochrome c-type biogenesis protein CcmH/NrfG
MADYPLHERQLPDPPAGEPKLESWGEIAAYLRREIRTVQRWEKYQGLPVRRLQIGKLGSVYAYRSELDRWYKERQPHDADSDEPSTEPPDKATDKPTDKATYRPTDTPQPDNGVVHQAEPDTSRDAEPDNREKRKRLIRWAVGAASLLVLSLAAYVAIVKPSLPLLRPVERTRLFVRPFTNHSGNAQQDEFISGLTDEIITQLGRIDPSQLGVISPTSSKLLAAKPIDDLAHQLNVQYVLEGSVSRSDNQVLIDAQLISVRDQTAFWSESYKDNLRDILQVQQDVSRAVAQQIRAKITGSASALPKPPAAKKVDPAAYDAYLKGRLYWTNRDLQRSIDAFQQALQKEPDYTLARSGLASAYLLLGQVPNDVMPPNDAMPKARSAAQQALALDPASTEAHCVLANIAASYDWNFAEAERQYQRAIALDPNNSTAHEWYGHYLIVRNRLREAQDETSHALDLDPVSPLFNTARAETYYYARDFDASIAQAQRTLEQYPRFPLALFWLASAHREKKMYAEAVQEFDQLRKSAPDNPAMLMAYGHALAVSGDKPAAQKILADLTQLAQRRYVPAIYFAVLHVGLGEQDAAFKWFDKAYGERNDRLVYLGVDPLAEPLRSDPRFAKLLSRIGLS